MAEVEQVPGELEKKLGRYEWRYTPAGRVKHAVRQAGGSASGVAAVARCGYGPPGGSADWYGTGSQSEYERVEALPRCSTCVRLIRESG